MRKLIYMPRKKGETVVEGPTYTSSAPIIMGPTFAGKTTSPSLSQTMTGFRGEYAWTRPTPEYSSRGRIYYRDLVWIAKTATVEQITNMEDRWIDYYNGYYTFIRGAGPNGNPIKIKDKSVYYSLQNIWVLVASGSRVKPYKINVDNIEDFEFLKMTKVADDDIIYSVKYGDPAKCKQFFETLYNIDVSEQKEYVWDTRTGRYREATSADPEDTREKGVAPKDSSQVKLLMTSRFAPSEVFRSTQSDLSSNFIYGVRKYLPETIITL